MPLPGAELSHPRRSRSPCSAGPCEDAGTDDEDTQKAFSLSDLRDDSCEADGGALCAPVGQPLGELPSLSSECIDVEDTADFVTAVSSESLGTPPDFHFDSQRSCVATSFGLLEADVGAEAIANGCLRSGAERGSPRPRPAGSDDDEFSREFKRRAEARPAALRAPWRRDDDGEPVAPAPRQGQTALCCWSTHMGQERYGARADGPPAAERHVQRRHRVVGQ